MLKINNGQAISLNALVAGVAAYGFTRVDRIERIGEFSVRGDVMDIWTARQKHPTRIMFFGDEIENIKSIHIGDFSAVKKLDGVRILPFHDFVLIKRHMDTMMLPPRRANVREQFLSKFKPDTAEGTLVYHRERGLGQYIGTKVLELGDRKRAYYIVQYSRSSMLYVPTDQSEMLYNYCGNARRLDHI